MLQKSLKKIILYGIPVLYFLIAISFYLGTYDSAQIKITLLHVGGLFLIMSWLLLKIEQGNFSFLKINFFYIFPIVLFLLSGAVSLYLSPLKFASLNEFIKRFIYCGIVFIMVNEFDDEKKILRLKNWLIAAAYVVCAYGLVQIFDYYSSVKLDPFLWRQAFSNRIMSTFGNPNFFGDFLIVMSPITLAFYIYKRKFYLLFLWILIAVCAYQTLSKGTWLGFAAGIFVFSLAYVVVFFRDKLTKKVLISAAICILIVASGIGYGIYKKTSERTDSASFRVFTWLSTWEMINTNPMLGTGIGTFYVTYPSWRRPQIFFIEGRHNTESDHPENEYLEVWYDEGIIGLTIFLVLIVFVLVVGYKNMLFLRSNNAIRNGPMLYIQLGVTAAFAAQLAHNCVCVSLRFVSSGSVFWLMIGVTLAIGANLSKERKVALTDYLSKPSKIFLQLVVTALFIFSIVFTFRYFVADFLHTKGIKCTRSARWEEAIVIFDKVNKYNPSFPMAVYFKGKVYNDRSKAGDLQAGVNTFEKLWTIAPNYVQSKLDVGILYEKLFDQNKQLLEKYKADGKAQETIAQQEIVVIDSYNRAVNYYRQYLEIDPVFALTYYRLAALYSNVGFANMAEKTLLAHLEYPSKLQKEPYNFWVENWAERRIDDYSETYLQLGNFYLAYGKINDSKNAYIKAVELNSRNINAKKNLAEVYEKLGDQSKATEQWTDIYNIDHNDIKAKMYLESHGVIPKHN
jgi:putative inorganic carbon (HCO3(-)) transporter